MHDNLNCGWLEVGFHCSPNFRKPPSKCANRSCGWYENVIKYFSDMDLDRIGYRSHSSNLTWNALMDLLWLSINL